MSTEHPILVVEDSDEDFVATERVFRKFGSFKLARCSKGTEVLERLTNTAGEAVGKTRPPSLILLDLNLPGKLDGRSVLTALKADSRYRRIPVVIVTTSSNPQDVLHCFEQGAAGYLIKPVNLEKFVDSVKSLVNYWFETTTLPPQEDFV